MVADKTQYTFAPMETMGDRIKQSREAKGWSQDQLAALLTAMLKELKHEDTVSGAAVSQWERGETKNIKNVTFYLLAKILDVRQEYLLFGPQWPRKVGSNRSQTRMGTDNTA